MKLDRVIVGPVRTNCYLLMNEDTKELIIVDPGDQAELIKNKIEEMQGRPIAILLTHGHYDHILGIEGLKKMYEGLKIYACETEKRLLSDPAMNHSAYMRPCSITADVWLHDQEKFTLAGINIEVIETPGHTAGSCCYYLPDEKILLSGDTLFAESVGRTDLPTGSMGQMNRSIKKLFSMLPDEVDVYPGHEFATTIEHEKRYNPFA